MIHDEHQGAAPEHLLKILEMAAKCRVRSFDGLAADRGYDRLGQGYKETTHMFLLLRLIIRFFRDFDCRDLHLVAPQEPGLSAAAMGTNLPVVSPR